MGLFGKGEDELRATGSPAPARVTYMDDTGKRRNGGAEAKVKFRVQVGSGNARGRELDKTKWVPVTRMPRMGDNISIRIDMDDPDDWAWGDGAMYQPASAPAAPTHGVAPMSAGSPPPPPPGAQPLSTDPFAQFFGGKSSPWGSMGQLMDLSKMVGAAWSQGNMTIEHNGQVIDARGNPELRQQIIDAMKMSGIDVEAMERSGQIPPAMPVAPVPPIQPHSGAVPQASAPDDLTTRLRRLDELRAQGLITEEEHREQRQRIIDTI